MTLLRLNGIPARWQSGMVYSDGDYDNLHDWGWLYLAPYGWVPMDVTTGQFKGAERSGRRVVLPRRARRLPHRLQRRLRHATWFRANSISVRKPWTRNAAKWSGQGGNLYFDQWDYTFEAKVLPAAAAAAPRRARTD